MAGSTFGEAFRVTNAGESHGAGLIAIVDGCPAGIELDETLIQHDLDRRRPGQNEYTTQRQEADTVEILSGVYQGETTGTPIGLLIHNTDQRSKDYQDITEAYRPSHADYTYDAKYGRFDPRGGGRSSARITAVTVAAGAIAKQIITPMRPIAYVKSIKDIEADIPKDVNESLIEQSPIRCPDLLASKRMQAVIRDARKNRDSVGGIVECVMNDVRVGLGEPVFDKLDALLAYAMLGIPATKGFEIGSGFDGTREFGSEHNDSFTITDRVTTITNKSGGVQGGISNGMPVLFRVAFKPTATIGQTQQTVTREGNETTIAPTGRHDPCVVPRAVPIVEALTACVLADLKLRDRASRI